MAAVEGTLTFGVPGGRIRLAPEDLDGWASHAAWAYGLLGVGAHPVIAVQDFGSSPLSFLASALLTPGLGAGVAERMQGRAICLDASHERVALTPAVLRQVRPDVLVVREEVLPLLLEIADRQGVDLSAGGATLLVATTSGERGVSPPAPGWTVLLVVEHAMLIAPRCADCHALHLRAGVYEVEGTRVRTPGVGEGAYDVGGLAVADDGACPQGPDDRRFAIAPAGAHP